MKGLYFLQCSVEDINEIINEVINGELVVIILDDFVWFLNLAIAILLINSIFEIIITCFLKLQHISKTFKIYLKKNTFLNSLAADFKRLEINIIQVNSVKNAISLNAIVFSNSNNKISCVSCDNFQSEWLHRNHLTFVTSISKHFDKF